MYFQSFYVEQRSLVFANIILMKDNLIVLCQNEHFVGKS